MPLPILYFDTCAVNRLSDDLSQPRIRTEAAAVLRLLDLVGTHQLTWIASTIVEREISQGSDSICRIDTMNLLSLAAKIVRPSRVALQTASRLIQQGFASEDALHLAVAQQFGADGFITTDDRLISLARRKTDNRHPEVINPVDWLQRRQS